MTNADKFKNLFGIYATELWSMPEKDFLKWLNCSEFPNNSDTISRQAAIDAINALHDKPNAWLDCAVDAVMALQTAQPEIIRCKDCKYCDRGIDKDGNPFLKCLGWVYGGTQEEDFCSHAERREE